METMFADEKSDGGYPTAIHMLSDDHPFDARETPRSLAELELARLSGSIRDKQAWHQKINDTEIVEKWERESGGGRAFAYAIAECRWMASQYAGPSRPAAVEGVFCRDDCDGGLVSRLKKGVELLRSRPAIGAPEVDRHPGTPQIVDLVHPSLYAYEAGVTPVLGDATWTSAPPWDKYLGRGVPVDMPHRAAPNKLASRAGLQWLPSEFYLPPSGCCEIHSYINCLHPKQYASLYADLAALFEHAVPCLEDVLAEVGQGVVPRQRPLRIECKPHEWWVYDPDEAEEGLDDEFEQDLDIEEYSDVDQRCTLVLPEVPANFEPPAEFVNSRVGVSLRGIPLQVIVKIASLEIEAGGNYAGGTWHVEGMLNERIVATACFYLDSDNIAGGELQFRTVVTEPSYEQGDHEGVRQVYGLVDDQPLVQPRGACSTLPGRLLAFPNSLQHRVSPVELINPAMPGRRVIICFFLCDPTLRVRSTATVPPQPKAWMDLEVTAALVRLLPDKSLRQRIAQYVSGLTYQQATLRRERLMNERVVTFEQRSFGFGDDKFFERTFSLCEH